MNFLEQFGRDICVECSRSFPKDEIDKGGWCIVCRKREAAERKQEEEYLKSPQYEIDQENFKREEEERKVNEELRRKDLEDNFYWSEGRCVFCQCPIGRYINNLIVRPYNPDRYSCGRCQNTRYDL